METSAPSKKPIREKGRPIRWYRPTLDRQSLASLNRRSDFLGFAQTAGYLGILGCTGAMFVWLCRIHSWWAAPALLLHGGVCAFLINGFHELVHDSVFKTRGLNRFFLQIFSFLGWYNHVAFWASHTAHHRFTLHPPDDLEVVLPQQVTLRALLRFGIFDPNGIRGSVRGAWRTATGKLDGEWNTYLFTVKHPEMRKALHRWAAVTLVGHGIIAAVSLVTGWWPVLIALSFGRFFGSGLQFLCNSTQHIGLVDEYPDFRVACRTFTMNPVLEFLYWYMNYHTEHHMFAGVPCYHLRRLHREIRDEMPPATHGLFRTWLQISQILKRQAADPSYQYWPELPSITFAPAESRVIDSAVDPG